MTNRETIFGAIEAERNYQGGKWGAEFDNKNTLNDWKAYITTYLGKVGEFGQSDADARHRLLQVAALAVAALEQEEFAPRHYD